MKIKAALLTTGAIGLASIAAAQDLIEVPVEGKDRWYYTSSQVFGENQVQMHYFHVEGAAGFDVVSDFNCKARTIKVVFESRSAPETFPLPHDEGTEEKIKPGSAEEYLAKAACSRNDLTLEDN
ncbi:hypothetical protein N9L47_07845 [Rhodobacteraceae bacterium]|nr:hypothetical protein [Paracoccaceae bacterium]